MKMVFREGVWHTGIEGDAETVYERLSYSWNDLGEFIQFIIDINLSFSWNDLGKFIQFMIDIYSMYATFHWTFIIHIVLPVVEKVEISKSTDKKSDSFEVEIYKTDKIPQTDSTVGLTRFVGNKTKLMLKLN